MIRQKYTILFGGTKNVGDFLYFSISLDLLKKVKKLRNIDFLHINAFENLENYLNQTIKQMYYNWRPRFDVKFISS